jgi:DNA-binding transcriptional ArsR family regulator
VNDRNVVAAMRRNAARATRMLKSIANEQRLLILCQLAAGERSAGELGQGTGLAQSAVSQHLAVLRRNRLVSTQREAQRVLYALRSEEVRAILQCLHAVYCTTKL